jgi:hypothetical protein
MKHQKEHNNAREVFGHIELVKILVNDRGEPAISYK